MASETGTESAGRSSTVRRRLLAERLSSAGLALAALFAIGLFALVVAILVWESAPILAEQPLSELLLSSNWNPAQGEFGFLPAIVGTLYVTGISMAIGIPLALLSAIYLAEYADGRTQTLLASFIDVLAAVPGVVFGLIGLIVVVPFVGDYLAPALGVQSTGLGILTASLVLSIIVVPYMVSLTVESLEALPDELRESALALGMTKWGMIRGVLLRAAGPGILSAILLGFGRAFGATMAVVMVIGGMTALPDSVFEPGQTLSTLIVNDFGELMSVPTTQSALIFVGLMLLVIVWTFNLGAMLLRRRLERRWQY
ncbi:phosphate ABC transporter permease subunit PstC [Halalkalicoccus tibetensis]|uniref:Phosphate transport system permease protein n=1 Tax=Halalkalicoccus tibetensis TaxID=175632 RepID=A0ABD5V2F3_9EURY